MVIPDVHEGLKQAISTVLVGATWLRCRADSIRDLLATVPAGAREPIAAIGIRNRGQATGELLHVLLDSVARHGRT